MIIKDLVNLAPCSSDNRRSIESGYILIWFSMTILGLLFAGFTFMLYAEATILKAKAQYIAMNLTTIGAYNAEFDTPEALSNMTLLAQVNGFRYSEAVEDLQIYPRGAILLQNTTTPGPNQGIKVYIELIQNPIIGLLASLGDITTSSFSHSKQTPLYLNLAFDYSSSLGGGSINQLLEGFGVIDSLGAVGPNGLDTGSAIEPNDIIQTVMPFAFDPYLGIALPWNEPNALWPTLSGAADPGCTTTKETTCPSETTTITSHLPTLKSKASDIFMSYKKTAALLTGVVGRISPHLDISVFGGMAADDMVTAITDNIGAPFPAFVNNGVYPIHQFDETIYDNYDLDAENKITADAVYTYTYDQPKDLFRDPVSMAPNRILQLYLEGTFSRKLLKYATLYDSLNTIVMNPGDFSPLLDPPLPVVDDPQISDDSFTYNPGPLINGTYQAQLSNELLFKFGWPGRPTPLLSHLGPLHPANDDIPLYIRYPWEFNCSTGPPLDTATRIVSDPTTTGAVLCHIYKQCNPSLAIDCVTTLPAYPNVYRKMVPDGAQPPSPYCDAGFRPLCSDSDTGSPQSISDAVICINGVPRCFPTLNYWPKCVSGLGVVSANDPACCNRVAGACDSTWDPTSNPPSFGTHNVATSGLAETNTTTDQPIFRGRIEFPEDTGADGSGTIFHYLSDLVPLKGGTWTQNTIPISRCQDFKDYYAGHDPDCALILVTDNRPFGVDATGTTIKTDAEMMTELTANVDSFSGSNVGQLDAKIFTWYLDHSPSSYDDLVNELQALLDEGTLDPIIENLFVNYVLDEQEIPLSDCGDWDANPPASKPDCDTYNNSVLPAHQADQSMQSDFQTLMSTGSNRIFVESTLTNTSSGPEIPASFFNGLKELLATLKKEVRYQR